MVHQSNNDESVMAKMGQQMIPPTMPAGQHARVRYVGTDSQQKQAGGRPPRTPSSSRHADHASPTTEKKHFEERVPSPSSCIHPPEDCGSPLYRGDDQTCWRQRNSDDSPGGHDPARSPPCDPTSRSSGDVEEPPGKKAASSSVGPVVVSPESQRSCADVLLQQQQRDTTSIFLEEYSTTSSLSCSPAQPRASPQLRYMSRRLLRFGRLFSDESSAAEESAEAGGGAARVASSSVAESEKSPQSRVWKTSSASNVEMSSGASAASPDLPRPAFRKTASDGPRIILRNVAYMSSIDVASVPNHQNVTVDDKITKDVASEIFCRRIMPVVPEFIQLPAPTTDRDSEDGGEEHDGDMERAVSPIAFSAFETPVGSENGEGIEVLLRAEEERKDLEAQTEQMERALRRNKLLEKFFICVIVASSATLVAIVILVTLG